MEIQTSLSYDDLGTETALKACLHCGNPTPIQSRSSFCCLGCETVYHWIHNQNLNKFYEIKTKDRFIRKPTPVSELSEKYSFLDKPEFLELYSWEVPEGREMEFYLEGVHCSACVWISEKVPDLVENVVGVRLNLGTSIASVRILKSGSFASVAERFQQMGYHPHPIKRNEKNPIQQKENRMNLIRIGIAGTSAGNIMLLAVSLYGGAEGELAESFKWLSFVLFLPVLLFSAVPFYKSAWNSVKARVLSIDIPVVFGILLGSVVSIINLFTLDHRIYFDSLSALVFLLLSTRHLLKKSQQAAFNASSFLHFVTRSSVRKWDPAQQTFYEVRQDMLEVGDRIQVLPGECFPVDGLVKEGSTVINSSLLSGETQPEEKSVGSIVFAGTVNLDAPVTIEVTQSGVKTRLGRILDSIENLLTQKASITVFADRVSRYFVGAVILLSFITFLVGVHQNWIENLNRALAVAIVTCPCTFAFITPWVLSRAIGKLAQKGILVKGPQVLEKLTQIQSVYLDKTGTLTTGELKISHWDIPENLSAEIMAVESRSSHPIAKAIVNELHPKLGSQILKADPIKETAGQGIRGLVQGHWIELKRSEKSTQNTEISAFKDGNYVGCIAFSDQLKPGSKKAIQLFRKLHLEPKLLSGDQESVVSRVAQELGIKEWISEVSPEKKAEVLQKNPYSMMIGDGANDALALAQAYIGVAVHSGIEISLKAADIYMTHPDIQSVYQVMIIAQETLKIAKRNLWLSLIYNGVAAGFALAGKIDPLFAAVLMPSSALTVFLSSIVATPKSRKAFREINS